MANTLKLVPGAKVYVGCGRFQGRQIVSIQFATSPFKPAVKKTAKKAKKKAKS